MGVSTGMHFPSEELVYLGPRRAPRDPSEGLEEYERYWFSPGRCRDAYMFHGLERGGRLIRNHTVDQAVQELYTHEAAAAFKAYVRSIRSYRMRVRTALRRELEWKGLLSHTAAAILLLWGIPGIIWVAAKLWGAALAALAGS